jgi:hypothetical protein
MQPTVQNLLHDGGEILDVAYVLGLGYTLC